MKHYVNEAIAYQEDNGPWSQSFYKICECPEQGRPEVRHEVFRRFRDEYEPAVGIPAYFVGDSGLVYGRVNMTETGPEFERYQQHEARNKMKGVRK